MGFFKETWLQNDNKNKAKFKNQITFFKSNDFKRLKSC